MEEDTVMFTFTAIEIDLDYEFDAARYFDFEREESVLEVREAELWFDSAKSYPPSPFVTKFIFGEDILPENVTASSKIEALESMDMSESDAGSDIGIDMEISAMDMISRVNLEAKRSTTAKQSLPRMSTLMKPTASQLAKQTQAHQMGNIRFMKLENYSKITNSSPLESQPAKRQKLERGHMRKVTETNQLTHLVHKEPKKNKNIDGKSIHPRLHLTIPIEPTLPTAHMSQSIRPKLRENEQLASKGPTFRARPLNRKILDAPSMLFPNRSTPQMPEFQEFHLKTSERAMLQNSPSCSTRSGKPKVLRQPKAGSIAEYSNIDPRRTKVMDAPKQEGSEADTKFKALPLNKKIFSSKGDTGVCRNKKKEPTVPMEFNIHTEGMVQHDPPVELFNMLTLTSELQSTTGSQLKLPRPACILEKGSKENKMGSFQRETEVKNLSLLGETPRLKLKQIPSSHAGVTKIGFLSSMSRSSRVR